MAKRRRGSRSRHGGRAPPATSASSASSIARSPASRRRSVRRSTRSRSSSPTSPRPSSCARTASRPDETLYGLYEGVPRDEWGADWVPIPDPDPRVPPAARGGLPGPGRPRRRGPDHDPPRARPPPGHRRRRPARRARDRLPVRQPPDGLPAAGSGALARSSPSRSMATLPPDSTRTRGRRRGAGRRREHGRERGSAGGLEDLLQALDGEPEPGEDRRVVDEDHVLEVAPHDPRARTARRMARRGRPRR